MKFSGIVMANHELIEHDEQFVDGDGKTSEKLFKTNQ